MGSSRATSARLAGFLNDVANRGIAGALKSLNLESLAGRTIGAIFEGLTEYMCPDGGNLDEAIARNAFLQTVADITEGDSIDLNNLGGAEVQAVFEIFTTHAIEARLFNEVGTKAILLPADTAAIDNVQSQLHDFIANGVSDAMSRLGGRLPDLSPGQLPEFVDEVLENAFTVLAAMGEAEAER
jgi:hypothetical protein